MDCCLSEADMLAVSLLPLCVEMLWNMIMPALHCFSNGSVHLNLSTHVSFFTLLLSCLPSPWSSPVPRRMSWCKWQWHRVYWLLKHSWPHCLTSVMEANGIVSSGARLISDSSHPAEGTSYQHGPTPGGISSFWLHLLNWVFTSLLPSQTVGQKRETRIWKYFWKSVMLKIVYYNIFGKFVARMWSFRMKFVVTFLETFQRVYS